MTRIPTWQDRLEKIPINVTDDIKISLMQQEIDDLREIVDPSVGSVSFYYMTDRMTFIKITGCSPNEIKLKYLELWEDHRYGMAGAGNVLDKKGKEIRRVGTSIHWNEDYEVYRQRLEGLYEEIKADREVMKWFESLPK